MTNAAFLLSAESFESVYGDECVKNIARSANLLSPRPLTLDESATNPPAWLRDVEVLLTGWGSPALETALLARMPRLKAVFHGAGSLRSIVTTACWEREIVFSNAAALNAIPVIEYTVGAIFLSFKRAWHHAREVRRARTYEPLRALPGSTGVDATVGLLSLGLIGRGVASRLRDSAVRVIAHDPLLSPEEFAGLGIDSVSLEELFARSDVLSVHTPLLPETQQMITRKLLDSMRPRSTFINTARGGLLREDDLVAFLGKRPDVQAILDVLEPEPPPVTSPLYDLTNVFITPHIAGSIGPECRRMGRAMVFELERYIRQQPLLYRVSRAELVNRA